MASQLGLLTGVRRSLAEASLQSSIGYWILDYVSTDVSTSTPMSWRSRSLLESSLRLREQYSA